MFSFISYQLLYKQNIKDAIKVYFLIISFNTKIQTSKKLVNINF
jgi:hypothetical protein